ncbi:unnamed protein product [Calypogeia fissa]
MEAPVGNRKMIPCRNFQAGFCRFGDGCRFSHDPGAQRANPNLRAERPVRSPMRREGPSLRSEGDSYSYWLNHQATLDSATNIEFLSGEKGYHMLTKLIARKNLPHETIDLVVKLLAREDIRTSLLRQQTNKIYGALTGSPFLLQLRDHIACHVGMIRALKARDVRPYLALTEELQSRTIEGWKEVPLNELTIVVAKLEDSAGKNDLLAIVVRLTDQSERMQRLLAARTPKQQPNFQGQEFRKMSIVPGKEELLEFQAKQRLPVNSIGVQYSRVSDYLETHFRLLREDCIDPLRQGIKTYRSIHNDTNSNVGKQSGKTSATLDLRIYLGVQLAGIRCGDEGVEFIVSFHLPASERTAEKWESSKKLMFGSLLCISSDQFQTFFWGVVARRDVKDLAKGLVGIRIIGESDAIFTGGLQFKGGRTSTESYVMVESTASYFEAYHHVLKTLQREEMENIPFTPYLLHLEPRVRPPSYLQRRKNGDEYDFSSAFPDIYKKLGKTCIRIMGSEWPSGWADSLDRAQQKALKQGLTKELAIIQGPPGTGKTFLGLILVKILLANLQQSPGHELNPAPNSLVEPDEEAGDFSGPIVIICYTNHALDQFLEGIYHNGETNLIRIGGRGKSELLKDNTLQSLLVKQRTDKAVDIHHHRIFGRGRFDKDQLESKIHKCIDAMGVKLVTDSMLDGVATREQKQSLLSIDYLLHKKSFAQIVKLWLTEVDPHLAQHFIMIDREEDESDDNESSASGLYPVTALRGLTKLLPKSEAHEDGEWMQVRRRGHPRPRRDEELELFEPEEEDDIADEEQPIIDGVEHNPHQNVAEIAHHGGAIDEAILWAPDVWQLTLPQRKMLHEHWLEKKRKLHAEELGELTEQYEEACKGVKAVENEMKLSMLRKAKVVGMTTTAAAKHHDVITSLKPEVVIVEEAAEVLEGHILACINPSVKHLILIGDHLQLRPSVAVYELAIKYHLDLSMFERLVRSGVEHVTLQEQRRMRPSISKLVRGLYPGSRDHESVARYEDLSGVKSNIFFFDHKTEEDNTHNAGSKVNSTEAKLVVELCLYLLNQGCYKAEHIAILSMYTGQLQEIKRLLKPRILSRFSFKAVGTQPSQDPGAAEEINLLPRVSSVDDYQGEESDIIILSLVRSNSFVTRAGVGKIGFLNISNRICVALTRARKGMFIFGNADLLAKKSTLWNDVTTKMRNSGELGPQLELHCQNHPGTITKISTAEDFKQVEDGGCSLPCDFQLDCGHACPRRCHPGSHDLIVCPKSCLRQHDDCSHSCNVLCHGFEDCPPCKVIVTRQLPHCKHLQGVPCSNDLTEELCRSVCRETLQCGHRCKTLCGRPCTELCAEKVVKKLPCGHSTSMACHQDPTTFSCDTPCQALLPDCQHRCQGSCGKCKRRAIHIPCKQKCGRNLPCGHACEAGCSLTCPPCAKKCRKRCFHSRCSGSCGDLCKPCREPCSWQCEHHKCEKRCHEICTRPRCDLPCAKLIPKCGHRCIGLCGEPCPKKCRICHPETMDIIMRMTLEEYEDSDRFVQLEDCGHLFEVSGLDKWMEQNETAREDGSVAIKLKECPECRTLVWRTHRYSNVVKQKLSQVEAVKDKVLGRELSREGYLLLDKGDHNGALQTFLQVLQQNPDLMEAQFGIGCAFFAGGEFGKAIPHLSLVVKRSSFASSLARHVESARRLGNASGFPEQYYRKSSRRAGDPLAIRAMVQWASALTRRKEFTSAIELCDAILRRDPQNQLAKELSEKAKKGEAQLVVQAMAAELEGPGHWYTCPNGHFYTIGECGGAMQLSKCPDCKAQVGGGQHRLTAGNRHSNIDGSERSVWPGH